MVAPKWVDAGIVLAVCLIAAVVLWNKLNSLIWLDPAWWLHETLRFARGEFPYRDFLWQYPPLGLAAVGYPLRYFGIDFSVAQVVMDLMSLAIVLLVYAILGYLVPRWLRVVICIGVIVVGATNETYFSLFSLLSYCPALHPAAIGLLMILLGCFRYLAKKDEGGIGRTTAVLLIGGSWITLLSKQEPMLAAPALLLALAVFDPFQAGRRRRWMPVLAAALVPVAAVYVLLIRAAGWENFSAAMRGYGLATMTCPWWPTGLGIFSVLAAVGAAGMMVAAASLVEAGRWRARLGRRYFLLLAAGAAGSVIWAAYQWYNYGALLTQDAPVSTRLSGFTRSLLSSSPVLLPVLWSALLYCAGLFAAALRDGFRMDPARLQLLLVLSVPALIGIRGLFGRTIFVLPEAPALAYPFLVMVGPYLLARALEFPAGPSAQVRLRGERWALQVSAGVVLLYAAARLLGAYPNLLSNGSFTTLSTESGMVRVRDGQTHAEIYRYVMAHTQPGDAILELPYGGGMTFATRRRSPVFSTVFTQVPFPEFVLARDVGRVRADPPRVVVALDGEPHFGTYWGIRGNLKCAFPRLVWAPDRPSWDPAAVLPVTEFIETHYRRDRKIGQWVMLLPKNEAAASAR